MLIYFSHLVRQLLPRLIDSYRSILKTLSRKCGGCAGEDEIPKVRLTAGKLGCITKLTFALFCARIS